MLIRVIDFETTGFPPNAGVCEAGWTDVLIDGAGSISIGSTISRLCRPGLPIQPQAEAVHGISESMIADSPPAATVFKEMMDGADVFCAHNCEFEQNFFGGGERPWICTYKVALRIRPDLPNHKNGTIPTHLGIHLDPDRSAPLHRAGPDTYVTARILEHFLREHIEPADAIRITKAPREVSRMPFGKHQGTPISELPLSYMQWAVLNLSAADVVDAMKREMKRRAAQ